MGGDGELARTVGARVKSVTSWSAISTILVLLVQSRCGTIYKVLLKKWLSFP